MNSNQRLDHIENSLINIEQRLDHIEQVIAAAYGDASLVHDPVDALVDQNLSWIKNWLGNYVVDYAPAVKALREHTVLELHEAMERVRDRIPAWQEAHPKPE